MKTTIAIAAVLLTSSVSLATFDVQVVHPSVYDPITPIMDANLGITPNWMLEDFEDTVLTGGIEVVVSGNSAFTISDSHSVEWDGDSALHNVDDLGNDGRDVTFTFSPPVHRLGMGVSHLEQFTRLLVNDIDQGDVRNLSDFVMGTGRNGYLWVTATDGDLISTVTFDGPDESDTILIDHVAFPEPATALLLLIGSSAILRQRRR